MPEGGITFSINFIIIRVFSMKLFEFVRKLIDLNSKNETTASSNVDEVCLTEKKLKREKKKR